MNQSTVIVCQSTIIVFFILLTTTLVYASDGGPNFAELNGINDDAHWTCPTKYYTLAQLVQVAGSAALNTIVCSLLLV
jgi:hypothetical protein